MIEVADGGSLRITSLTVKNAGWCLDEMDDERFATSSEEQAIRGFTITKHDTRRIVVDKGQDITVNGAVARKSSMHELQTGKSKRDLRTVPAHGFSDPPKNDPTTERPGGHIDPASVEVDVAEHTANGCKCTIM